MGLGEVMGEVGFVGGSGPRVREIGVGDEGIFISASIRTLVIFLGVVEAGRSSLLATRVQEKLSPT